MPTADPWAAHQSLHPEQYRHPLCGRHVRFCGGDGGGVEFVVHRVFTSRFGSLAASAADPKTAYPVSGLVLVPSAPESRRSCSWCHRENRVAPGTPGSCPDCGHRADLCRLDCDCPRCRPPLPLAAKEVLPC